MKLGVGGYKGIKLQCCRFTGPAYVCSQNEVGNIGILASFMKKSIYHWFCPIKPVERTTQLSNDINVLKIFDLFLVHVSLFFQK